MRTRLPTLLPLPLPLPLRHGAFAHAWHPHHHPRLRHTPLQLAHTFSTTSAATTTTTMRRRVPLFSRASWASSRTSPHALALALAPLSTSATLSSPIVSTASASASPTIASASSVGVSSSSSSSSSSPTSSSSSATSPSSSLDTQPASGRVPLFNTYKLVARLMAAGLTEQQAVVLMEALVSATSEALAVTQSSLVTNNDFSALKGTMNEKLFNASLKYDMQQKHIREMFKSEIDAIKSDVLSQKKTLESDLAAFRSDVKMSQKTDLFALQQQVNRLEKEHENEQARYKSEQEQLENRLIKYALGFVASFGALTLTAIRLMNM